ncbi:MAG: transcriptional regulator [Gammaproteobacteria bacterium]|nr:MAG: transcriptional regulator [Gammaproteobacteria bacterium]
MLNKIKRHKPHLSPAEQNVADWILDHPSEAIHSSLATVASAAGTSEPTVIRFCRSIGPSGFREMKLRLAETLSRPTSYMHRDVNPDDSVNDAVTKVMDRTIQAMIEIRSQTSSMPFEQALGAMTSARQLVFVGLGASGHVSRDACQKFFRLGIPCSFATDTPIIVQTAAVLGTDDVMVVTSHTGNWPDVVRAVNTATENGAFVIALTDPRSSLAAAASLVFECQSHEDTSIYTPMSSRLAHLALLDALQVVLALKMGQTAETNLQKSKRALAEAL